MRSLNEPKTKNHREGLTRSSSAVAERPRDASCH